MLLLPVRPPVRRRRSRRSLCRVRIVGPGARCPPSGGFVLAPSHRSMMDIPFAAWLSRRAGPVHGQGVAVRHPGARRVLPQARAASRSSATAPTARRVRESVAMLRGGRGAVRVPRGHAPARARRSSRCSRARRTSRCARACRSCRSASRAARRSCASSTSRSRGSAGSRWWSASRSCPPARAAGVVPRDAGRRARPRSCRRAAGGARRRVRAPRRTAGARSRSSRRGSASISRRRRSARSSAKRPADAPRPRSDRRRTRARRARRARERARAARAAAGSTRPRR